MNNTSIKSALSLAIVSVVAMMSFISCEYNDIPSGPKERNAKYDTVLVRESSLAAYVPEDIMNQCISVRTASNIGQKLAQGAVTPAMYYVIGIVYKRDDISTTSTFYIRDNEDAVYSFEAYKVKGVGNKNFSNINSVRTGDTVIIKAQLQNYYGTIETKGGYVYATTNDDAYPMTEAVKWEFKKSFCNWTVDVKQDAGFNLWTAAATTIQASGQDASKVNHAGEAWLISPEVNLKAKKLTKPRLNIAHYHLTRGAEMNPADYLKMFISTDGATWQQVAIPAYTTDDKGLAIDATLDARPYMDCEKFRIAFDYISTEKCAAKWCIKEVKIYEIKR
ncbi:MAG: hypothetical protein KBS70_06795 [Bacteroidales bacterium]|nr:hypothetical protein [Candidatus Colicola equi]